MGIDINNMPAGLEMNALVAVEVMGWQEVFVEGVSERLFINEKAQTIKGLPPIRHQITALPNYSTDIATAWKITQHLREKMLYICKITDTGEKTYCILVFTKAMAEENTEPQYYSFTSIAETAPLAICRTALKSKMESQAGD